MPSRVVLIGGELSPKAAALWSGRAATLATRPAVAGDTQRVELGKGVTAFVRIGESVDKGLTPDATADDACALATAVALARNAAPLATRPVPKVTTAIPLDEKENPYAEMTAPDVSYRLIGLFRLWSVIDRFRSIQESDRRLGCGVARVHPALEAAEGADAYARAMIEFAARIDDGHVRLFGPPAVWNVIGSRRLPFEVRRIEGRLMVTAKATELPANADIAIGDEIVSVDGDPLADRV